MDRKKIEANRPVLPCGNRDQIAPVVGIETPVDVLQIRRFPSLRRTTVDELELDLAAIVSNQGHAFIAPSE